MDAPAARGLGRYGRGVLSRRSLIVASTLAPAVGVLGSCTRAAGSSDLRLMVPNAPGGGYDTTARVVAQVLEDADLTRHVEVFNVEGGSGVAGLARIAGDPGNANLLMMMGLGVVGAVMTSRSAVGLDEVTPIARLISEPEVIAVAASSPYATFDDLLDAWTARPKLLRIGGGSSPGGPDHLCTFLLVEAAGIAATEVQYNQYDGGGPLLAALFTGAQDVAISGVGEALAQVRTGELRILAVTGERVDGLDAPTVREAGVDMDFVNWRGLVAPPLLEAGERDRLAALVTHMHSTDEWARQSRNNGWNDDLLGSEEFASFLAAEQQRVSRVLKSLGLVDG